MSVAWPARFWERDCRVSWCEVFDAEESIGCGSGGCSGGDGGADGDVDGEGEGEEAGEGDVESITAAVVAVDVVVAAVSMVLCHLVAIAFPASAMQFNIWPRPVDWGGIAFAAARA